MLYLSLYGRLQSKNFPSNHNSKAEIPLIAGQTMKFKTSITPCYSETAETLSYERSNIAVCPFLRLSHDLTAHASITDNNIEITVRSAKNSVW